MFSPWTIYDIREKLYQRNEEEAAGINPLDFTENEQSIEIKARKNDATVIHKNKQLAQKEARANIEQTRKRCLETFTKTSRKTTEANDE